MKTIKVSVKAKVGKLEKTKEFDYDEPETLEEAIEEDSKETLFKTYLIKRKTNFQDKQRKDLVDKMTKAIQKKLEELGIEI